MRDAAIESRIAIAIAVSRPLFWLNSASLCAVALILSDRRSPDVPALILILFATWPLNLLVYALNDLHDHETDRGNPRKGSAEGARADVASLRRLVRVAIGANAPFVAFFAGTGPPRALLWLAATYLIAWAYSAPPLRLKSRPGWDSLANAGYALPLVFGCAYLEVPAPPWREAIALAIWAVGSHAFTSIQDVTVDRAAGLRTVATALGERSAGAVALLAYLAAGAFVAPAHPIAALLLLGHVTIVGAFLASTRADAAHLAYRRFISWNVVCGFLVVTAIALAHPPQTLTAAAVMVSLCAAVAAAVWLTRRPEATVAGLA
jgi:4-hydroxybenzoate polyprenyltransferase